MTFKQEDKKFKAEQLYCFVEILPDGNEAIIQTGRVDPETKQVFVMPLITGSKRMADKMKQVAQEHANQSKNKVLHLKLAHREVLEEIEEKLVEEKLVKDFNEYLRPPS